MIILLMGVSGSGKTTVGKLLAQRLSCQFADADDFHSSENKAKMKAGIALTDADRSPWLAELGLYIDKSATSDKTLVIACSALKNSYRQILAKSAKNLVFVYLKADFETIATRLKDRHHHFMNPELLKSQFETLEEPTDAIIADAGKPLSEVLDDIYNSVV